MSNFAYFRFVYRIQRAHGVGRIASFIEAFRTTQLPLPF